MKLGKTLRSIRKAKGIKIADLALLTQASPSYVAYIEQERKWPSLAVLGRLSVSLNVPVITLLMLSVEKEDLAGMTIDDRSAIIACRSTLKKTLFNAIVSDKIVSDGLS